MEPNVDLEALYDDNVFVGISGDVPGVPYTASSSAFDIEALHNVSNGEYAAA